MLPLLRARFELAGLTLGANGPLDLLVFAVVFSQPLHIISKRAVGSFFPRSNGNKTHNLIHRHLNENPVTKAGQGAVALLNHYLSFAPLLQNKPLVQPVHGSGGPFVGQH